MSHKVPDPPDAVLDANSKLSIELYVDSAKQIITLSTTIIAFVAGFAGNLITSLKGLFAVLAIISWICLLLAVGSGLLVISAIVGMIDPGAPRQNQLMTLNNLDKRPLVSVYNPTVRALSCLQWLTFIIGLTLTVVVLIAIASGSISQQSSIEILKQKQSDIEMQATLDSYATFIYVPILTSVPALLTQQPTP